MSEPLTVLPTAGKVWLEIAKSIAVASRRRFGTEFGLARAISRAAAIYPSWRRCPVRGPDGEPFFVNLVGTGFGLLTSGFRTNEIEPLLSELPEDAIILDVGANIGIWTRLFAHHARRGQVYAFEPSPSTFALLQENTRSFGNIICVEAAIGSTNCQMAFAEVEADSPAQRHLLPEAPEQPSCTVEVRRLDDWVAENKLTRIDLIKIDVEGFEEDVLEAGRQTLIRLRPVIVFEFIPKMAGSRSRFKGERLFPLLGEHGYRVLRLDKTGGMHENFGASRDWTSDYVAFPR